MTNPLPMPPNHTSRSATSAAREPVAPWREFVRAPLVPFALAATFGLILDFAFSFTLDRLFFATLFAFIAWVITRVRQPEFAAGCLFGTIVGLAASHHHIHRHVFPANDVGQLVSTDTPIVHLRGLLIEPPLIRRGDPTDLFGPSFRVDRASTILDAEAIRDAVGVWHTVTGRVRIRVERPIGEHDQGLLDHVQVGDRVELVGRLTNPLAPGNPGEWNSAEQLLDSRIRAEMLLTKTDAALTRLDTSARSSYWLEQLRGYFTKRLEESLPPRQAGLARALLLGDGSAMSRDDWDAFARTGVVHVLAISGQHLVILSGFLGLLFRMVRITPRRGAWVLIVVILGYALLTGARPSAMRAAVMVVCVCGGWLLRRPIHLANTFALAWLIVLVLNPHDPFTSGCQLSFISVFTLIWLLSPWFTREPDPLERLLASARPAWEQHLRSIGWLIVSSYIITFVLLVVNAPIIMLRQNLVPPIGTLLGPPLVLFTTIALVVGFVLLLADGLIPLGFPLRISLAACDWLVQLADRMPGGTVYTTTPPLVWVIGFYLLLIVAILLMDRRVVFAWLAWVILGLIGTPRTAPDELRVTFLSVGHGGCTVIECPDGRVMLYDAGTMAGSSAVPRIIAPYLWHRGIARIDEVFLSHADLDHYNGVAALLKRFPVGQITLTPSFATKPTPQVASVLLAIREHRVPIRAAVTGQRFIAGEVTFEVLHPPPIEFGTSENERSLVLKCVHRQHVILLTGDVEKQGTQMLLRTPPLICDVLMAPHHGSRSAMSAELLRWASPKLLVVSCGGRHDTTWDVGVPTWDTWTSGAITIRSQPTGLVAESFRRGERIVVQRK